MTLQPGVNFIIPIADRVRDKLDIREQVFTSVPQPVITEDNVVVRIDTVLYYQITDPRAAAYEVADYLQAIDQLTVTTLRNLIGSIDLEEALTSRESINAQLRTVLDEATGRWGIRVNRVELKAIDPPNSIVDAMEKQMRAERDKRATILHAEGERQSLILTAEGRRQQEILVAQGENNTFFVIPGEFTEAMRTLSEAFGDHASSRTPRVKSDTQSENTMDELTSGSTSDEGPRAIAAEATDSARASIEEAERSVRDAHAEALELGAAEVAEPEVHGQS